ALAVGAAGRGALNRAQTGRVERPGGDVRADAEHAGDARLAGGVAGGVAADALRAERALALGARRARRAWILQAARIRGARERRQALVVVRAGVEAAGAVADIGAARDQIRRHALAGGVARRRRLVDVGGAGLVGAQGA